MGRAQTDVRSVPRSIVALATVTALAAPAFVMDGVRVETRVDRAVAQFGVTGHGVVVGVLDRGIDWTNNDFRNLDGTTRIEAIFDLGDNRGAHAPGNPYGVGTIYTRAQIDAALLTGASLRTRDAVGHGVTTTGIIAGNGNNLPDRRYRGIAPEATIVVVKVTGGAPAHDDQPAEASFYAGDRIPVAIDFVRDRARDLGMPCVMLLNVGSQFGPTDGTSLLARKIDDTVGPGKPGIVFVTGPGDDGGSPNRAGGTVAQGQSAAIRIQKGATGTLICDLWYPAEDRVQVRVETPAGLYGPFPAPSSDADYVFENTPEFDLYHLGADVDFFGAENGKRELTLYIDGAPGNYTVNLVGAQVTNGRFDGILNPSTFGGTASSNRFLTFVAPGSIWDGAAARYNICPGDYVFRTDWVDIDGNPQQLVDQGEIGGIWRGSSTGPTFDGRLGVDVCAPGDALFTSYGEKSYWATFRRNLIEGGYGLYGRAGAVSASAPVATGVIALMLEMDPTLDAAEVKAILQRTARRDAFTGPTENPTWGYGKIDAFGAVAAAEPGTPPEIRSAKITFAKGRITVRGKGFSGAVQVFVDGIPFASAAKVKAGKKVVQRGALANGLTLAEYVASGATAQVYVRNDGGGTAQTTVRRR
jgi:minor extracellular serine protease Vpr